MSETTTTQSNALHEAISETFTGMAFLDAIPAEPPAETDHTQVFAIQVRGDQTYRLVLDLGLGIKHTIVQNIHGIAWDELSSAEIDDCLLEFLNVLGGAFGRIYFGDDSRYKLSFPEVRVGIPDELEKLPVESHWFDAYGELFAVHVIAE